jgi:5-oxoprolinase (ATP-hydrolysing)
VIVPKGSLLYPSDTAAVVGGNVLTSQRVVDVVLKAFEVCAASQGCMNNITFGEEKWGYYETVAGGAGAVSKLSNVFMVSGCKASVRSDSSVSPIL